MDRILGVAIGIATVCLLFSILASHVQEIWASFSARRAVALEIALQQMLSDATLSSSFFAHPLIQSISYSPTRSSILRPKAPTAPRPAYIAADLFNKVLQSILVAKHNIQTNELPAIIAALPDSEVKRRMRTLTLGFENDAAACNAAIEKWYDDTMDRVNGFYKRNTQVVLLALGLVLAVACNVNLLLVSKTLWSSSTARDALAAVAQNYGCKDAASCKAPEFTVKRDQFEADLKSLPLGYEDFDLIGYWQSVPRNFSTSFLRQWAFNLIGWLLTAIAISLGAPFWFDLINKFINIRMVGQKPPTAQDLKAANVAASQSAG
jgi:hypothetical protein